MTKRLKKFDANRGVQLDANFVSHKLDCARCAQFDAEKPATASAMCLEGAVLYKRNNPTTKPRVTAQRSDTYASKAQVKSLMRYRGE